MSRSLSELSLLVVFFIIKVLLEDKDSLENLIPGAQKSNSFVFVFDVNIKEVHIGQHSTFFGRSKMVVCILRVECKSI